MSISNLTDQVTNLDLSNKLNQVIAPVNSTSNKLLDTFIPANTVLKVELDGSGDFTNLMDAINYLTGKWSNGEVVIQLGNGTFEVQNTIMHIQTRNFNFSRLTICGKSKANTILYKSAFNGRWHPFINIIDNSVHVYIHDLTVEGIRQDNVLDSIGIWANSESTVSATNLIIQDFTVGIASYDKGVLYISNLEISNTNNAVQSQAGLVQSSVGTSMTIKNSNNGYFITEVGIIKLNRCTTTTTNVTSLYNTTKNTLSSAGMILVG